MKKNNIKQTVLCCVFIALVVVFQFTSGYFKIGAFSITLTLIPVVVGAMTLGKKYGAILGLAFGLVVLVQCVTGIDAGGHILFNLSPVMTTFIVLLKGTLAGYVPAVLHDLFKEKEKENIFTNCLVAVSAPVVNTLTFVAIAIPYFNSTIREWAGSEKMLVYILTVLIGINFIIEFTINLVLAPVFARVVKYNFLEEER